MGFGGMGFGPMPHGRDAQDTEFGGCVQAPEEQMDGGNDSSGEAGKWQELQPRTSGNPKACGPVKEPEQSERCRSSEAEIASLRSQ